jgi:hypothetical protein
MTACRWFLDQTMRVLLAPVAMRLPLDPASLTSEPHMHVTNRSFNALHPDYDEERHNRRFDDVAHELPEDTVAQV